MEGGHGKYFVTRRVADHNGVARLDRLRCIAVGAGNRVLGLDVGSRTIGVAVSDELGMAAHGVTTLQRRGTQKDVAQVLELVRRYQAERIIVGMPYELDGSEGRRAVRVRVFYEALAGAGLAVDEWDERYSTVEAEATLLEANVSRARRKEVIDQMAAQVILQGWLDARSGEKA
jgi:putative Holliday junction resolvase